MLCALGQLRAISSFWINKCYGKSSVMFGLSWTEMSVLGSQVLNKPHWRAVLVTWGKTGKFLQ